MTPAIRILAAVPLALAAAARADVFSPGDLSQAHAHLEGLGSCTRCHVAGEQLSQERCLECHRELQGRVEQGRGLHGRIPRADRACERCHPEHQGRDFQLVDWGKGGKKAFDHARTGFELGGKHRRTDCARCHDRRLVADPVVAALLAERPKRETHLGAPQACAACHFDEHRGQLGTDCGRCHGEDAWKPARGFAHARTAYQLDGRHVKVECARCHRPVDEPARAAGPGMTAPVSAARFVRYKPVAFASCLDCHKDPHASRFGASCTSCHTTADWRKVSGLGAQRAFHEKTRYPLRGAHAGARCEACHGPFPGVKVQYKGIAFARCTDCHADAHLGQLGGGVRTATLPPSLSRGQGERTSAAQTCDRCHSLDAWLPARFEAEDHDATPYRLEGAHRAVACGLCHPKDPRLAARFPAAARKELERRKRPVRVSLALLHVPRASDCRTCHRDPHGGQFEARQKTDGCGACHGLGSFRQVRFDHAKDARFPLTGRHEKAACGSCHRPDARGIVQYRPVKTACAACHADPHLGQLAVKGQGTDCARCHETGGWKAPLVRFVHAKPFTSFTLDGKHRNVECAKCHPVVRVGGAEVRRYRPVPTACEGCHADVHRGAFRGFVP